MYVNEVKKSITLQKMEVAESRISYASYPSLMKEANIYLKGYKGEKDFTYYLNFLPDKDSYIIHNLRLFYGKSYFQIDYLILISFFSLIIDCKNYAGTLDNMGSIREK